MQAPCKLCCHPCYLDAAQHMLPFLVYESHECLGRWQLAGCLGGLWQSSANLSREVGQPLLSHLMQACVMTTRLCAPPCQHLEACGHMVLDGVTAMPHLNVKAHEGSHKVRTEVLLQGGLLNPHPLPTEAKE